MQTTIQRNRKQNNVNTERQALLRNFNWIKNDEAIPEGMRARVLKQYRRKLNKLAA
jgi:hypothetical protein